MQAASIPRLDCAGQRINECADSVQHHAARNQVPGPSNTSDARLPLRRLGSVLAGRLDQRSAVLSRNGGTNHITGQMA